MVSRKLMIGISVLALGAGTAHAQTSTNVSDVTQTGTDNVAEVDNARAGNRDNRSTTVQNGNRNRTTVVQIGNVNVSQSQQIGNDNLLVHTQEGDFNQAEGYQLGDNNRTAVRQRGLFNSATVTQDGNRNTSQVAQGVEVSDADFFNALSDQITRAGDDNRATVNQIGSDLSSTIRQRPAAGGASAGQNVAKVSQRGLGSSSSILQESRGNYAEVFQFEGGAAAGARNSTSITQRNTAATSGDNPVSGNRASVSVRSQGNSSTLVQNGRNNEAEITQGLGQTNTVQINQVGSGDANRAAAAQYGNGNAVTIGQDSAAARASVWQQAGPASNRSSNNSAEIQQGTGTTGSAQFSASFFNNSAPTGIATRNLTATIIQGNNPEAASWNIAQVRQDGIGLTANVQQLGSGTSALPNIVRIAQQGGANGANIATAIQRAGVGPSSASDSAPTGQQGDEFFFAGGARSAEINILQSGSSNSATVEQRGRGQFARIEQGPGSGNTASILQDVSATNATAIVRQTGSNNSYSVTQAEANQYILVSQTGNNNEVTNSVRRGPGS